MTARLTAAATILFLLAGAAGAAPLAPADRLADDGLRVLAQAAGGTVSVRTPYANLRAEATTKSAKIGQVKQGQRLEVVSTSGDWVQVKAGDKTGYVNRKLLNK